MKKTYKNLREMREAAHVEAWNSMMNDLKHREFRKQKRIIREQLDEFYWLKRMGKIRKRQITRPRWINVRQLIKKYADKRRKKAELAAVTPKEKT